MGGATLGNIRHYFGGVGLSPRGRGNQGVNLSLGVNARSIPAWAGQPPSAFRRALPFGVYPRVGGATLGREALAGGAPGLSPRGRGNRTQILLQETQNRSIPAWAGQPGPPSSATTPNEVYPRVGGATGSAFVGHHSQ